MYKVGIDVGGTFTDIAVQDAAGTISHGKVPSRPGDESAAVIAALELMAQGAGLDLQAFLAQTEVINFGTTVATNAMLQHKGVPTAMLTTRGFRDIIEMRRGYKEVLFDIRQTAPQAVVPREWRLPVTERMGPGAQPLEPLDEADVRAAARKIREGGIESVAICFMNSYLNPDHERQAARIVHEMCPEVDVHLSSDVLPKVREYERFSTTAVNAFLSPLLRDYINELMRKLRASGYKNRLFVMQSNGGAAVPELAGRMACTALLSGPAGGVAAAARIGGACGVSNIIGVDMGGTSYDVSLIKGGEAETRAESWFNRAFVGIPMLAIHTIGAGGGSIAWVDDGGALRVGPQSAGARPGPACYGTGGDQPTTTDVFLHLGYLNPDFFLGGRMTIRPELADEAIKAKVADHFGMSVDEAAFSISRIINNHLSNGIRYVSVAQGHDPRDFSLMSFGGAGSVTVCMQARDLGIRKVLIPRSASVFCAVGELLSDLRVTQLLPCSGRVAEIDAGRLEQELDQLFAEARAGLEDIPGVVDVVVDRKPEMRYVGQVHELLTPLAQGADMKQSLAATVDAFHQLHHQKYAFDMKAKPVEMLAVRQEVIGVRNWSIPSMEKSASSDVSSAIKSRRNVCFPSGAGFAWTMTDIFDGKKIEVGHVIEGPAVIEEVDTTIVLYPGDRLRLNKFDVYEIDVQESAND